MSHQDRYNFHKVPVSEETRKGLTLSIDDYGFLGRMLSIQDNAYEEQFEELKKDHEKQVEQYHEIRALIDQQMVQNGKILSSLEELKTEIKELKRDVANLKVEVKEVTRVVDCTKKEVHELAVEVDSLTKNMDILSEDVQRLKRLNSWWHIALRILVGICIGIGLSMIIFE